jgi:two-component system, OmpR family, phosphate regulon sensor histidine kinase PhoR
MRPRGSIISQLLIAFSVSAVLIALAAVVGYAGLARQDSASKQLSGRDYVLQQAAGRMQQDFTISQLSISGFVLSGRTGSLRPVTASRADFATQMAILRQEAPPGLQGLVLAQARAGTQLFAAADRVGRLPPASTAARKLASGTSTIAGSFYAANAAMQESLAVQVRQLTAESKHSLRVGLARSAGAIALAVALILILSLSMVRSITAPLRGLAMTVRRLTSDDHAARVAVHGSAEVREVAESVNTMADENDRLRRQEEAHTRLRALTREAGIIIREHFRTEDVLREASAAIAKCVDSDLAVMRLAEEENPRYADSARSDWLPVSFPADLSPNFHEWASGLLRSQSSTVIQDVGGVEGEQLPAAIREPLLHQGVVSHMATPFGIGAELYGVIELERTRAGHPWTAAEVDAVQSLAADLGRGLKYARMYEEENRLVEQLKTLDQTKSDLFATVSHELRAPLTSIEGYVEMLRDEDAGEITGAQERMLETIDRNAIRLRNLIEDLFMLSKIESGAFQAVLRPVNLLDVVRDAAQVLQPSVDGTGLTLTVTCPDRSLLVNGDAGQLDRVVMNLLSNAAKFTPPGGQIRLTAARIGDAAVLSVTDTGIGIPAKDKDALFARFFRASNAVRRSIPGTGLGLTIVQTVIADHGGYVDVQSTEGVGTTVTVRLPLLPVDREAAGAPMDREAAGVPVDREAAGVPVDREAAGVPVAEVPTGTAHR